MSLKAKQMLCPLVRKGDNSILLCLYKQGIWDKLPDTSYINTANIPVIHLCVTEFNSFIYNW